MSYSKKSIEDINENYKKIDTISNRLLIEFMTIVSKLKSEKSRKYLQEGVGRRLDILARCIHNIFEIFPVEIKEKLERNNVINLTINLHAFIINISGILDCLAWVFVLEKDLFGSTKDGKLKRSQIGLFENKTQEILGSNLKEYLESNGMKNWWEKHLKNYRDALAHRIPLYVPPFVLNNKEKEEYLLYEKQMWDFGSPKRLLEYSQAQKKQNQLGSPSFFYVDSTNKPMYLHAQVITDFLTIEQLINKSLKDIR